NLGLPVPEQRPACPTAVDHNRAHVPRPSLSRRAGGARQPAVPARQRARAAELHAEDAEPAQPGGVRPARMGSLVAHATAAVLLWLAVAAGFRPQPEEPRREGE